MGKSTASGRTFLRRISPLMFVSGVLLLLSGIASGYASYRSTVTETDGRQSHRSDADVTASRPSARAAPTLLSHDFGFVPAKHERSHTFTLRNDSSTTWTVRKVRTVCNCTVAEVSRPSKFPRETSVCIAALLCPGPFVRLGKSGAAIFDLKQPVFVQSNLVALCICCWTSRR